MHYRRLGNTGLLVSELCLGTNTFGGVGPTWANLGALDQKQSTAVMKAAFDAGINFIDTADMYGAGESEQRVGQGIRDLGIARREVVIATKVTGRMGKGPNEVGSSRHHILTGVEDSLRRLNTDYIDLYMVHFPDPATPLEETMRALDDVVSSGKVRYIGCSNYRGWQAMKAVAISERQNLARFEIIEAHWSIVTRESEREIIPMAKDTKMGILVWGALLGGLLTGKFGRDGSGAGVGRTGGNVPPAVDRELVFDTVDALTAVAKQHNVKVSQVALAWLLNKSIVTSVLFGARDAQQVADNVGATDVKLTAEDMAKLDAVAALPERHDGISMVTYFLNERAALVRT